MEQFPGINRPVELPLSWPQVGLYALVLLLLAGALVQAVRNRRK